MEDLKKLPGQLVGLFFAAILITIVLYYYYGGTQYIKAITSGLSDLGGTLLKFPQQGYPTVPMSPH